MGLHERIKGVEIGIADNEEIRLLFNKAIDKMDFSIIETLTLTLDYEIKFATTYMCPLSFDLKGNQINDVWSLDERMKNIFVSIFPESGKSYVLISWLTSDHEYFKEFAKQINEIQEDEKTVINVLNNMVVCHSDNFALSPAMVERWDEDTKKFFLNEFTATFIGMGDCENVGQVIEKNLLKFPCKFDLFEH